MWVEDLPSGKFRCVERYEDFRTGKTKKVSVTIPKNTAQNRKAAQIALTEKINKALGPVQKKDITFNQLIELHRAYQEKTVKASTLTRNFHAGNTLMEILGADTLMSRMSAGYVNQQMLKTGDSAGTINERLKRLRSIVRWGYKNDHLSDISWMDKLENMKDTPHRYKIRDKFLESDELQRLLAGMEEEFWRLLTKFLVLSGLRFGEAAALQKKDVDLKNKIIYVNSTYDVINDVVTDPKTPASIREVYIQPELDAVCRSINAFMLRRKLMCVRQGMKYFMFDEDGGFINFFSYNKYLKDNAERILGREKITPHVLRHTHVSLMAEQGVDLDTISRRLGHENSKVTREIYLHVTKKMKERDRAQIEKVRLISNARNA